MHRADQYVIMWENHLLIAHALDLTAHLEDVLLRLDNIGPSHQEEGGGTLQQQGRKC